LNRNNEGVFKPRDYVSVCGPAFTHLYYARVVNCNIRRDANRGGMILVEVEHPESKIWYDPRLVVIDWCKIVNPETKKDANI
jgi:hypothetical protein